MNSDIRLSVGFWHHPKTKKTVKKLGLEGIQALQVLWLWVAVHRPDGKLSNMDWEDIELASDWQGEEKAFFNFCIGDANAPMWIDVTPEGEFLLHDWVEHNPWQADAEDRSNASRFVNLAKVNKPIYDILKKQGVKGLSKEEYERYKAETSLADSPQITHASPTDNACVTDASPMRHRVGHLCEPIALRPLPLPSPSPKPEEKNKNNKQSISGKLGRAREEKGSEGVCKNSLPEVEEFIPDDFFSEPSGEFQELRATYDEHGREEASLTGFDEYKQLRASGRWVGLAVIRDAIFKHSKANPEYWSKFAPGLARFLREHWWEKEPKSVKNKASPSRRMSQAEQRTANNKRAVEGARELLFGKGREEKLIGEGYV